MCPLDALDLCGRYRIPLGADFHTLNSETVESINAAADCVRYRKSKGAPGSRARMFYAYLQRRIANGNAAALRLARQIETRESNRAFRARRKKESPNAGL
jgi:hypothetical protein